MDKENRINEINCELKECLDIDDLADILIKKIVNVEARVEHLEKGSVVLNGLTIVKTTPFVLQETGCYGEIQRHDNAWVFYKDSDFSNTPPADIMAAAKHLGWVK